MKAVFILILFTLCFLNFAAVLQGQNVETVTISTYYPSPTGVYNNLRLLPTTNFPACAANREGVMYYNDNTNLVMLCQETAPGVFTWQNIGAGFWTQANTELYPNDTNLNLLAGSNTALANGRVQITHPAVPLIFTESDYGDNGARWRMPLDGGVLRFDTVLNPAGPFTELGVLSMASNAPAGRVGIGMLFPQVDLDINNTLHLTPVSASSYNIEGGLYYDSDDHRFKYHDNTGWKNLGAQLGVIQEYSVAIDLSYHSSQVVGADVSCPANAVATGLKLYSTCALSGSNSCSTSSEPRFFNWNRIGLKCAQIQ